MLNFSRLEYQRNGKYSSLLQNENSGHQTLRFQFFINTISIWNLFVLFFHVVCKISNFDMWTANHLTQVSCTELTLHEAWNSIFVHEQFVIFSHFVIEMCKFSEWTALLREILLNHYGRNFHILSKNLETIFTSKSARIWYRYKIKLRCYS